MLLPHSTSFRVLRVTGHGSCGLQPAVGAASPPRIRNPIAARTPLLRCITFGAGCGVGLLLLLCGALLLSGCASIDPAVVDRQSIESRDVPARAQTLYEQAVAAMAAGERIDAELRLQAFLLQYPDYPGAYVNLAIIQAGRGDEQAAEQALTTALMLDPQHPPALNQLGMLYRRQGKFPEAEDAYLQAIAASPDYAFAHYNLGVLNDLYLQRMDAALRHYERYQEIAGEDKGVGRWITDLRRRIDVAQRTANVTE